MTAHELTGDADLRVNEYSMNVRHKKKSPTDAGLRTKGNPNNVRYSRERLCQRGAAVLWHSPNENPARLPWGAGFREPS